MTALNVAYDEPESRSLLMFNAVAFALTAVLILFGIAVVALVAVLPAVVGLLPLPAGWLSAVSLLRWPMLAAFARRNRSGAGILELGWGIAGALLAVPITAALVIICEHFHL